MARRSMVAAVRTKGEFVAVGVVAGNGHVYGNGGFLDWGSRVAGSGILRKGLSRDEDQGTSNISYEILLLPRLSMSYTPTCD